GRHRKKDSEQALQQSGCGGVPRESRLGILELSHCSAVFLSLQARACNSVRHWPAQIICCIRGREELHCTGRERRARQLLSLVSIYLESIQAAGGVSVSDKTEKNFDPLASRVGFLF